MGKYLKIFILSASIFLIAFLVLNPYKVQAQEEKTAYEKAYQSYLDQMATYQSVHQEYVLRKSQYESFKTLQAQQDAQTATVKMMQERDEAVLTYLKALKERVNENPGLDPIIKNDLNARIDTEVTWFSNHKSNIPTAGSLKDLSKDSRDASEEFTAAQATFYRTLGSISDGRFTDLTKRFNDRFTELKDKLTEIKSETRPDYSFSADKLQRLDRWVFDAEARIDRAMAKQAEAQTTLNAFGTSSRALRNIPDAYTNVLTNLNDAQQYMKEAGGFLQEIVRDVKTLD
jgi:hypothetical protein